MRIKCLRCGYVGDADDWDNCTKERLNHCCNSDESKKRLDKLISVWKEEGLHTCPYCGNNTHYAVGQRVNKQALLKTVRYFTIRLIELLAMIAIFILSVPVAMSPTTLLYAIYMLFTIVIVLILYIVYDNICIKYIEYRQEDSKE